MRKIANTAELTSELERVLEYAGSYQPSRVVLASQLMDLSKRVAAGVHLAGWGKSFGDKRKALEWAKKQCRDGRTRYVACYKHAWSVYESRYSKSNIEVTADSDIDELMKDHGADCTGPDTDD